MTFSKNVQLDGQRKVLDFWGLTVANQHSRYLGLSPLVGQDKKRAFFKIKCKLWQKLKGWKEKFLSQDGKEVLIKAVALSIPIFIMSCFKLAKKLCEELEQLMD